MLGKYSHTPSQTVVILRSQEHGLFEKQLPPAKLLSQKNKLPLRQRFLENICSLVSCANWLDIQSSICHKAPEMVIFQCNVFRARCELRTFGHLDTAVIVFPNSAEKPIYISDSSVRWGEDQLAHDVARPGMGRRELRGRSWWCDLNYL